MILVRTGQSKSSGPPVFETYLGNGRSQPLRAFLQGNSRPNCLNMAEWLENLTVGPHGDRAGDTHSLRDSKSSSAVTQLLLQLRHAEGENIQE